MTLRVPREPRGVLVALMRALPFLFSARMLAVMFLPLFVAAMVWSLIAWFAWDPLARMLAQTMFGAVDGWGFVGAGMIAALVLMLAAALTALVAIAVLAMPVIVEGVAVRDFPTLERRCGGTFGGSLVNALIGIAIFLPLWLLSLILLALPPVYVAATLVLNAWLNQRLFRYDALALHADREELPAVIGAARRRFFLLGFVLAPLSLIPFVNLIAPLYAGIAFSYLGLDELAAMRSREIVDNEA